ncbi:proline--tRNA ligase [Candidatus Viridilinea mediisalina]|uniref:Proline--tRNA ligase n=1 Tax=Candidatus Viridilinea mediisalina TaxID=2024553 RepID=A0A2A6RFK7_9CHLR|nr:proline--tRNA ligase [Candidatus Viridilinea mediisalina]PDW01665.1 proline--tRNA ligase [Candidatus Viridilinea mediisalina]
MRLSTLLGRTLREVPAEAEHIGYQLALRAGLTRSLGSGSFALLPLGLAALRRIEALMHAEMAALGAQEVRTPIIQLASLWEQTGRYHSYGPQMLKLQDRNERQLVFAPTHEEAIAELARREVNSYRQLPALAYQIHTKYRDELRTRGGLLRLREFTMLDVYSLDADQQGLDAAYEQVAIAFKRIFERCGVAYTAVEAAAGEVGGQEPREYMALAGHGEDQLALCAACGYAANLDVATARREVDTTPVDATLEEVATPATPTIADLARFLGLPEAATAKAVFFDTPERGLIFAVIRGDLEVNESKLCHAAQVSALHPASSEQISAAGATPGYASPVGLAVRPADSPDGPGVIVVADPSVVAAGALVAGANRAGYHLRHVVYGRDWTATMVCDIATVRAGDPCVACGAPLAIERGVELGHIFKLGTRYSEALGASYLAEAGTMQPIFMGSYGMGLERLLQTIIEQHHDERGIVWPAAIAPADVHLIALGKGAGPRTAAAQLYAELQAAGLRPLLDDRDETAGVKFNDADLIGLPMRLVISERLLASNEVELKPRCGEAYRVARSELLAALRG